MHTEFNVWCKHGRECTFLICEMMQLMQFDAAQQRSVSSLHICSRRLKCRKCLEFEQCDLYAKIVSLQLMHKTWYFQYLTLLIFLAYACKGIGWWDITCHLSPYMEIKKICLMRIYTAHKKGCGTIAGYLNRWRVKMSQCM